MPETKTSFSRGTCRPARTFFICARMEKSPQPGHQRTSWSDAKSLGVSIGSGAADIRTSPAAPGGAQPDRPLRSDPEGRGNSGIIVRTGRACGAGESGAALVVLSNLSQQGLDFLLDLGN